MHYHRINNFVLSLLFRVFLNLLFQIGQLPFLPVHQILTISRCKNHFLQFMRYSSFFQTWENDACNAASSNLFGGQLRSLFLMSKSRFLNLLNYSLQVLCTSNSILTISCHKLSMRFRSVLVQIVQQIDYVLKSWFVDIQFDIFNNEKNTLTQTMN